MATLDDTDDDPIVYKVDNTYFVSWDKLCLKARIVKSSEQMIMLVTQDGGALINLNTLLSAPTITGTSSTVVMQDVFTLNGCTVDMLVTLIEKLQVEWIHNAPVSAEFELGPAQRPTLWNRFKEWVNTFF